MRISDWSSDVCSSDLMLCVFSSANAFRMLASRNGPHLPFKPRALKFRVSRYLPTKLCAKYDKEFLEEMLPAGAVVADKLIDLENSKPPLAKYCKNRLTFG